jgi:hypothetical protein
MHAAIYDAVNAIDRTHKPYLVRLIGVSRFASGDAAADAAVHAVLVSLYPKFQAALDAHVSSCWQQFRKDRTRQKASVLDKRSRIAFWLSEVTMVRLIHQLPSFLDLPRAISSRHGFSGTEPNSRLDDKKCMFFDAAQLGILRDCCVLSAGRLDLSAESRRPGEVTAKKYEYSALIT